MGLRVQLDHFVQPLFMALHIFLTSGVGGMDMGIWQIYPHNHSTKQYNHLHNEYVCYCVSSKQIKFKFQYSPWMELAVGGLVYISTTLTMCQHLYQICTYTRLLSSLFHGKHFTADPCGLSMDGWCSQISHQRVPLDLLIILLVVIMWPQCHNMSVSVIHFTVKIKHYQQTFTQCINICARCCRQHHVCILRSVWMVGNKLALWAHTSALHLL